MFTLVVTQQFELFYFNPDNPISGFDDLAETFNKTWNLFSWRWKGNKIRESDLVDFFSKLEAPLGYRYVAEDDEIDFDQNQNDYKTIINKDEIAKQIFKMDLPSDRFGYGPFGVVLHAALKNGYGKKYIGELDKHTYDI